MANVQVENGHVRIANDLYEALSYAPFSATQLKILHVLVRLTYGWKGGRSVRLSVPDLAARCDLRPLGGFRRALADLIANDVVFELDRPTGRRPALYAINKNFEEWGRFVVHPTRLECLFSEAPVAEDNVFLAFLARRRVTGQGQATGDHSPVSKSGSVPQEGHSTPYGSVTREGNETLEGAERLTNPPGSVDSPSWVGVLPTGVSHDARKPNNDETLQRRKAIEIQESQTTTATAIAPAASAAQASSSNSANSTVASPERDYAIGLTTALNQGITEHWGEQPNPVVYATALQVASELRAMGVDLGLARAAIVDWCRSSRKSEPPKTVSYLRAVIVEAHRAAEQRAFNAADPGVKVSSTNGDRGGSVRPIASLVAVDADREKRERALRERYEQRRREAGSRWASDPANAEAYRAIVAKANEHYAGFLERAFAQRARDIEVSQGCAERSGFPDFETWRAEHEHDPPDARQSSDDLRQPA